MNTQNFCPRIHHGLFIKSISKQDLKYSVCCWSKDLVNSKELTFDHQKFIDLRTDNLNGNLPMRVCETCVSQEKTNKKSMRKGYLETHGDINPDSGLQYLDISIDMACNLACVTCGPWSSTTWRNELKIKDSVVRPNISNFLLDKIDKLELKNLREIRIWGGEPFLTNTHKQILEYIADRVDVSQIQLMYNTNGTRIIDEDTKKLIEKFKFARISFSIDAIGPAFEYIRYPAKWQEVEKNLLWWKNNLPHNSMLSMTIVASILNILYLDSVYQWKKQNFDTSCYGDDIEIYVHQAFGEYGLEYMPENMFKHFQQIKNYCQPWLQELSTMGIFGHRSRVKETLKQNDQRRNMFLPDYLPDVAKFIDY